MCRPVAARDDTTERVASLCLVVCRKGDFGLRPQRGDWRAQFVRSIRSETALMFHRRSHALEQRVEACDERRHLTRRRPDIERGKVRGIAPRDCPAHRAQRREAERHRNPEQHAKHGKRDDHRRREPARNGKGDRIPRAAYLTDLHQDLAVWVVARENPPALTVDLDLVEAFGAR